MQIPLDGPDNCLVGSGPAGRVRLVEFASRVSNIVCFLLNSTTRARPDFVVDFC